MSDASQDTGGEPDSALVCDLAAPFGAPVAIPELNTIGSGDGTFRTTANELGGYFWSFRDASMVSKIYYASRPDTATGWAVQATSGLDDGRNNIDPAIASDGSVFVFRKNAPDDLYVTTLITASTFAPPSPITTVNTLSTETEPFLQPEGNELVFNSMRTGGGDLYRSIRTGTSFSAPLLIDELSTPADEGDPVLSADGLTMYFRRDVGGADYDIFIATRASTGEAFDTAARLENVNASGSAEGPSALSSDGCRMYMTSDRAGDYDIYVSTRGQ